MLRSNFPRGLAIVLLVALLEMFAPELGYCGPKSTATAQVTYHLDGPMSASDASVVIALSKGYFADLGLDVAIIEGTPDQRSTTYVATHPKSIGIANVFDFLRARAAGRPVIAFAAAFIRSPITFYARRESGIRSVSDFAGKTVAYDPEHPTAIAFDALLARNQISKSTIKAVSGLRDTSALISRKIDILPGEVGQESHLLAQKGQAFEEINPDAFGLHLPGSVYFTNEDTMRNDPEIVRKFMRGIVRGWNTVYQKAPEDLRALATVLHMPEINALSQTLDQQRPLIRPSGIKAFELDPVYMNGALSILVQQRLISKPPRVPDAITLDVVREIYRSEPKQSFSN